MRIAPCFPRPTKSFPWWAALLLAWPLALAGQVDDPEAVDAGPGELEVREWELPWDVAVPGALVASPGEGLWFSGRSGDYLGHLDPESDAMHRFLLPEGTDPRGLVQDAEGFLWYASRGEASLGRLDPGSGEVLRFELPEGVESPSGLIRGPDGLLWFIAGSEPGEGFVGSFEPASGEVVALGLTEEPGVPAAITLDASGRPWVSLSEGPQLGILDPESMSFEPVELPGGTGPIHSIAVGADGNVWWLDPDSDRLARLDPTSGEVDQWPIPTGDGSASQALAIEDGDGVWMVAGGESSRLLHFDPGAEAFEDHGEVSARGGEIQRLLLDPGTGSLWFGTSEGVMVRIALPTAGADAPG